MMTWAELESRHYEEIIAVVNNPVLTWAEKSIELERLKVVQEKAETAFKRKEKIEKLTE